MPSLIEPNVVFERRDRSHWEGEERRGERARQMIPGRRSVLVQLPTQSTQKGLQDGFDLLPRKIRFPIRHHFGLRWTVFVPCNWVHHRGSPGFVGAHWIAVRCQISGDHFFRFFICRRPQTLRPWEIRDTTSTRL
jgi:hypothetical protein